MKKNIFFLLTGLCTVCSSYAIYDAQKIFNLAVSGVKGQSAQVIAAQKKIADFALANGAKINQLTYKAAFGPTAKPAAVGGADVFKDLPSDASADAKIDFLAKEGGILEGALGNVSAEAGDRFAKAAEKYKKV